RGLDAFRARDNGQYQRLLAVDEMSAVELRRNADGEVELSHRVVGALGIRDRADKIAAEPNEYLCRACQHRLDRLDRVVAVRARRLEAKDIAHPVEVGRARLFVDADRAVALDVRMTSDRGDARPGAPEIALEQENIGNLLHQPRSELMLGQPHSIADDGGTRANVDLGAAADLLLRNSRRSDDVGPGLRLDVLPEFLNTFGVLAKEVVVEHGLARGLALEHDLHHALEQRKVAADADRSEEHTSE